MAQLKPSVSINDQLVGNFLAPIVLVEFGDYQCPHCGFAHPLVKKLLEQKGNSFLFVFRNFPMQQIHPAAFMSAVAAEAAGKQDMFWEMHNLIFDNQKHLYLQRFLDFAEELRLDVGQFSADLENESIKQKVERDFESGIRSGVNGTPTFFINGELLAYDNTYESLLKAIESGNAG